MQVREQQIPLGTITSADLMHGQIYLKSEFDRLIASGHYTLEDFKHSIVVNKIGSIADGEGSGDIE